MVWKLNSLKIVLIAVFSLLSFSSSAQDTGVYNIYDSSVITTKRAGQQNEFMNNSYNFPEKSVIKWNLVFRVGCLL